MARKPLSRRQKKIVLLICYVRIRTQMMVACFIMLYFLLEGMKPTRSKKRKSKGKAALAVQERLVESFDNMVKSSNEQITMFVGALKESDEVDKNKLYADLSKLPRLSRRNLLMAMRKMSADDVAAFNVLDDDDERLEFVLMILGWD